MPRPGRLLLDYLSGQYRINLLEPRCWDDGSGPEDPDAPDAFQGTLLSQHISFLRNVFRVYKGFDTPHIDTLELMVERLYQKVEHHRPHGLCVDAAGGLSHPLRPLRYDPGCL